MSRVYAPAAAAARAEPLPREGVAPEGEPGADGLRLPGDVPCINSSGCDRKPRRRNLPLAVVSACHSDSPPPPAPRKVGRAAGHQLPGFLTPSLSGATLCSHPTDGARDLLTIRPGDTVARVGTTTSRGSFRRRP